MGGGDKLAELAAELALRGVDTDTVLAVLKQGGAPAREERPAHTPRKRQPRVGYVTHDQLLGVLAKERSPRMVDEIVQLIPGATEIAIQRHLRRAVSMGNVSRAGAIEPFLYAITPAGRAIGGAAHRSAAPVEAPAKGTHRKHEEVIAKLKELGQATAGPLGDALGISSQAARMHLKRAVFERTVKRHSGTDPAVYSVIGAGGAKQTHTSKQAKQEKAPAGEKATKYDQIVERARTAGPINVKTLQAEFGGTEQSIRLHLQRGVHDGRLKRFDTTPTTWAATGRTKRAPVAMGKPGENAALIVAALKKAGKPLDKNGFIALVPRFKSMDLGALYMALSGARKTGAIVRISTGLYGLPAWGAASPKGQKQVERPPKAAASKPPEKSPPKESGPKQLDLVPPAGALN